MRNLKQFSSEDALEKIEELMEYDIPEYANDDEYGEICDIVGLSAYETDESVIDEEMLRNMVIDAVNEGWLQKAKNLLNDIDLNADYWKLDGYGWAVDIDAADCQWLKDEIIRDLVDMLDDEDMEKYNDICEKYANGD